MESLLVSYSWCFRKSSLVDFLGMIAVSKLAKRFGNGMSPFPRDAHKSTPVLRYLGFLKGLVDSDTLPLSVSREILQEHASLKVIKKKIVRKTLDTLKQLAEADEGIQDCSNIVGLNFQMFCSLRFANERFNRAMKFHTLTHISSCLQSTAKDKHSPASYTLRHSILRIWKSILCHRRIVNLGNFRDIRL